jgi:hypothetical protein
MADSRYPYWITEQSPYHRGPTSGGILRLAVLVLIVVIAFNWWTAASGGRTVVDRKPGVSLCEEHQGRPGWDAVCAPRSIPVKAKR